MSRRFGRNQRRRAREELAVQVARVAQLTESMGMDRELLKKQAAHLREAVDYAGEVAEMVGREAVIAGAPTKLNGEVFDGMRFAPLAPPQFASFAVDMPVQYIRSETLRLLKMETVADRMRGQVHFRVTLADKVAGYTISESALQRMSEGEIERRVTPEIARFLVRAIKRGDRT